MQSKFPSWCFHAWQFDWLQLSVWIVSRFEAPQVMFGFSHRLSLIADPQVVMRHIYTDTNAYTWSFELSLISAHLEKSWLLGVFSRSGCLCFLLFIFRKKWVSFLVQLASFPVPCQEMDMFFLKWASFSWKMKLAEIIAKWVSRYIVMT